jgi:hypothetical protein
MNKPTPEVSDAIWRSVRKAVLDAYGGKCLCCGESTLDSLVLAYTNVEETAAEERRAPGQGTLEYMFLYRNGFPRNGRIVACRRCVRQMDSQHFRPPCGYNHDTAVELPKFSEFNQEAADLATKTFEAAGKSMDTLRAPESIFNAKQRTLTVDEQLWQNYYKAEMGKIYRRLRARKKTQDLVQARANVSTQSSNPFEEPASVTLFLPDENLTEIDLTGIDLSDWVPSPDQ